MKPATKCLIKYILITIAGVILYLLGAEAAYIQRGYIAYGGECFLLLLPLWWYLVETMVIEAVNDIKQNITEVYENEEN